MQLRRPCEAPHIRSGRAVRASDGVAARPFAPPRSPPWPVHRLRAPARVPRRASDVCPPAGHRPRTSQAEGARLRGRTRCRGPTGPTALVRPRAAGNPARSAGDPARSAGDAAPVHNGPRGGRPPPPPPWLSRPDQQIRRLNPPHRSAVLRDLWGAPPFVPDASRPQPQTGVESWLSSLPASSSSARSAW